MSVKKLLAIAAVISPIVMVGSPAYSMTYNFGGGVELAYVTDPNNDPAPDQLVCSFAADYCNDSTSERDAALLDPSDPGYVASDTTQTWVDFDPGTAGTQNPTDIASAALAKYDVDDGAWDTDTNLLGDPTKFSYTSTDGLSGTWSQTIAGPADIIAHYIVVKASNGWKVYGIDLSPTGPLSGVTLVAGDIISGTWSTAGILNKNDVQQGLSHLAIYNSLIPNYNTPQPVPLPAAGFLLLGALGGLGALKRFRRVTG